LTGFGFTLTVGFAPAPDPVMAAVRQIEVETSNEEAGVFRLTLAIAQTAIGDWTVLDLDLFRPLVPVSIRVTGVMGLPEAIINGYVTGQSVRYSATAGDTVLEVTGMDATLLMNLEEKVKAWPNMPDSAIAAAIFGEHTLIPRLQVTAPQRFEPQSSTLQRGTDIRFLRRLARRNGFECYVQADALTGLDQGFFQPPQLTGLPQAVLNVNMGGETNVSDFQADYDMVQPTTAIGAEIDLSTKAPLPALAAVAAQVPQGLEPALSRILPPPAVRIAATGAATAGELQAVAQGIADQSSFAVRASGTVFPEVGILRPGGIVNVRGAGRVFNGSYYLTKVSHVISNQGHVQRFESKRNAVTMTGAEVYFSL